MALRVGTEDKKKVYLAGALGAVMLILLVRFLWQNFGPSTTPTAQPTVAATAPLAYAPAPASAPQLAARQPYTRPATKVGSASSLDPKLHPELMRQAESLEYTGNGRNIFSQFSAPPEIPKPIASVRKVPVNTGPPPPAPPPPINLRFYGYAAQVDGHKQVFLLQGDDIFIASEGDVVDRRYRVGKIGAVSVEIEDLPYHNTQTLALQQ
jgi:hypothetical protein